MAELVDMFAFNAIEELKARVRTLEGEVLDYKGSLVRALEHLRWRYPAEEMPESGVPVIALIINPLGNPRRIRAQYAAPNTLLLSNEAEDDEGTYDEETDRIYCSAGWYETNEYEEIHWKVEDAVVAWMPLPEIPEKYRTAKG